MKKIIFFDVDNTIYNNDKGEIPAQTKILLHTLSKNPDVVLGLATGRGLKKLEIIEDVLPYFTYKVLVNGAYVLKDKDIIYDLPIKNEDIKEVLAFVKDHDLNIGMVGINDEAVNYWNDRIGFGMNEIHGLPPAVNEKFYIDHKVYQLWMFADLESEILEIAKEMPKFRVFPWHKGGADFTYPQVNKSFGIKQCLKYEKDYQLICIGDGANDIEMIEIADIGIAMDNTRFNELKEKADHIAPHIHEDQLHDFFKKLKLI
ncbi:HAD-IIB family hydrolase [Mariniplasma anaerobium]|uniref:Phosphatase n=1 Tax=Mariniplasma anaerobium TaxID=2735436 RepID=A0A7U9TIR5_9MOLU|nr:HAD-IIB family hydrolase [Mariniplasma anaerobium]BCR36357.1 phosphatase [Mariniplasma anaerobium]